MKNTGAKLCFLRQDGYDEAEGHGLLLRAGYGLAKAERRAKVIKAVFYAVQVFYSFFIM